MLSELRIKNLAILDEVALSLKPGFNVLTGETGAGKSMIVQAVHLLLGARASEDLIRHGAEEAVVEARFGGNLGEAGEGRGEEAGESFSPEAAGEVLLRRVVVRGGRSRCYINEQAVTLKTLTAVGRRLLSLSGQHEYQTFLAPDNHLGILDAFGGLEEEAQQFRRLYQEWRRLQEEWQALDDKQKELAARRELAAFQLQELEQADLKAGEEENLLAERERLRHSVQLWEASQIVYGRLYADKGAILEKLAETRKALNYIAGLESTWQGRLVELEELTIRLEDLALAARDYGYQVRLDPQRLLDIEQRLDALSRLKRKYKVTLEEALVLRGRLRQELAAVEDLGVEKTLVQRKLSDLARRVSEEAMRLSARRQAAAPRLARAVEEELKQVAMPLARFEVSFGEEAGETSSSVGLTAPDGRTISESGADQVEFFLAPNPGEPPKPLARIASGGELSRLLLVLKNLLAQKRAAETLVFDEVDAGIGGGSVASALGQKLQRLASSSQVICITHLPQIACCAAEHFLVAKQIKGERTVAQVRKLGKEERLQELARLLAGKAITPAALAQARELLTVSQG